MISRLHYITQDTPVSHAQLAKEACQAGIKWIQLRVKDKPDEEWKSIAIETKKVCDSFGVMLIINDNVHIAKEIGATGVHLGKTDMSVTEAREILGDKFIIGATANTFEDIKGLTKEMPDYIGLGPFRFTPTKKNLSPILGLEGYKKIARQCLLHNIAIPIIAIGGITDADVTELIDTGVYGLAVSSYITNAKNKKEIVKKLIKALAPFQQAKYEQDANVDSSL